jgi:hypothetical protein
MRRCISDENTITYSYGIRIAIIVLSNEILCFHSVSQSNSNSVIEAVESSDLERGYNGQRMGLPTYEKIL